ncbi:SIS domain-containing protein [bacterium]|nr:SIS domain-containing protein [bacterium]
MGDAENLLNEALDANKTRELLVRREGKAIVAATTVIVEALGTGGTLYVLGEGKLGLLARYLAHTFFVAEGGSPLRAVALDTDGAAPQGTHAAIRAARAFVGRGDVLLALSLDGAHDVIAQAVDLARGNGAATIALSGYPGESVRASAEVAIVVPSRRASVVVEGILAVAQLIERHVARRLGIETAASFARDPVEAAADRAPVASESSEAVVAELEAPRPARQPERASSAGHAAPRRDGSSAGHAAAPRDASSSGRRPVERPQGDNADDRRRANRVHVRDAIVSFAKDAFPDGSPPNGHSLENLSLTGISFQVKAREPGNPESMDVGIGDAVFVLLDVPAFVDRIRVQGDVRRIALLPDRTGFAVGVRFQRFLDDAQAKVRRLVENEALRGVRRRG